MSGTSEEYFNDFSFKSPSSKEAALENISSSCKIEEPFFFASKLIQDFEYLVSKNHLASNFARHFYRSNNFDGIIFPIQLNILVIAEEFETVAIDPQSRPLLVAYLGGRSFKFGSK